MSSTQNTEEKTGVRYRTPPVDICETADAVILKTELPGVEKEDIEIEIDGDELTVKGKRTPHDPGLKLLYGEGDQADYARAFSVGEELDTSNVEATLSDGVLTLTLHKKPEILPKTISIEVE